MCYGVKTQSFLRTNTAWDIFWKRDGAEIILKRTPISVLANPLNITPDWSSFSESMGLSQVLFCFKPFEDIIIDNCYVNLKGTYMTLVDVVEWIEISYICIRLDWYHVSWSYYFFAFYKSLLPKMELSAVSFGHLSRWMSIFPYSRITHLFVIRTFFIYVK